MENSKIQLLADDMNEIYSYIYKDKWIDKDKAVLGLSNKEPNRLYRHIVRYMVHRERAVIYKHVSMAEGLLFGVKPPHHSSIINSLEAVRETLRHVNEYRGMMHQIGFMYDLKKGYRDRGLNYAEGINKMMELPKHVLAITLASVSHHNLVHEAILKTLLHEYQELDEEFVKNLLLTKTEVVHV